MHLVGAPLAHPGVRRTVPGASTPHREAIDADSLDHGLPKATDRVHTNTKIPAR
jgi:hypothetical protein